MKFHKKFHLVALLAAILALNAQAAEVSSVQVKRAVSAWAAANGSAFANPGSVVDVTPVAENGTNLYWIVKMSNGGAVIASPDTDLDLVIAVLEKSDGTFPVGHPLPSILKKDMKNRLSIIRSGSASSSSSGNSGVRMASMLSATAQSTAAEVDNEVKLILEKAYTDAKQLLSDNRALLDEISEFLLVKETITGDELMAFVNADKERKAAPAEEETTEE